MSAETPHIEGSYKLTAIDPSGETGKRLLAISANSTESPELAENEIVDVLEAGACLVEVPGGPVYLALIQSGSITGPARLTQIPIKDAVEATREIQIENKRKQELAEARKIEAARNLQKEADARLLAAAIERSKDFEVPATVSKSEVEAVDANMKTTDFSVSAVSPDKSYDLGGYAPRQTLCEDERKWLSFCLNALRYVMVITSLAIGAFLFVQPYIWEVDMWRMILSCLLGSLNVFAAYVHFVGRFDYLGR